MDGPRQGRPGANAVWEDATARRHWKIKDKDGWILNSDGQRSAVVHQWDRFFFELVRRVDQLASDYMKEKRAKTGAHGG